MFLYPAPSMPIPRTPEAPCFNGRNLLEFMNTLESHLSRANIADEDTRVNYILRYSIDTIRQRIRHLPELDRSKTGKSWGEARTLLSDFYDHLDESSPVTAFHRWVQSAADRPVFVSKAQVNTYYMEFMSRGQPLLDRSQISMNDLYFDFIQGTPSSMKLTLRQLIPDARRTRSTPYAIKDTLSLLHSLIAQDDSTSVTALSTFPDPTSCSPSYTIPPLSTHILPLSQSPAASPIAPPALRSERAIPLEAQSVKNKPSQDQSIRDEVSQPEAEYMHASSDSDDVASLEVQILASACKQPSTHQPPNCGDLLAAARDYPTRPVPPPSSYKPAPCSALYSITAPPYGFLSISSSPLVPPSASSKHVAQQQACQDPLEVESDVPHEYAHQQGWTIRDEVSQPEAKFTHAFSDGDHTAKLEGQTSDSVCLRSGTHNPPNRGDLPAAARDYPMRPVPPPHRSDLSVAARAPQIQEGNVSTTRLSILSPHSNVQARGPLRLLYLHATDLHPASSPALDRNMQHRRDWLDRPDHARVGVGGYWLEPALAHPLPHVLISIMSVLLSKGISLYETSPPSLIMSGKRSALTLLLATSIHISMRLLTLSDEPLPTLAHNARSCRWTTQGLPNTLPRLRFLPPLLAAVSIIVALLLAAVASVLSHHYTSFLPRPRAHNPYPVSYPRRLDLALLSIRLSTHVHTDPGSLSRRLAATVTATIHGPSILSSLQPYL